MPSIAVRAAVAALNVGDIDGYLAGFSPASLRWVSGLGVPRTLDAMRSDIVELHGAFEPLHLGEDLLCGSPPRWVRSLQARRHERLPIQLVAR
jgi:hypothetical protein